MLWTSKAVRRRQHVAKILDRLRIRFEVINNYQFQWLVEFEPTINVFGEIRGRYVRFAGNPDIGFAPGQFPLDFLALLLVRNSEITAGAWQLQASGDCVWCNFGLAIPYANFNVPTVKDGLELLLAETHRAALRFRYLKTI